MIDGDTSEIKAGMGGKFNGYKINEIKNALWHAAHPTNNLQFENVLSATALGGGDTDTNAAICGALLGAIYGVSSIPHNWKQAVFACTPDEQHRAIHPRPKIYWVKNIKNLAQNIL